MTRYLKPTIKTGFEIYEYQKDAQKWMESSETEDNTPRNIPTVYKHGIRGGIIVMTMGLGKTLVSLYHIFEMQHKKNEDFPTLVVSSKTVMGEWRREGVEKFYPEAKVCYFHKEIMGKKKYESITADELRSCSIIFVTYDTVLSLYKKYKLSNTVCVLGSAFTKQSGKVIEIKTRERPNYNSKLLSEKAFCNMPWERVIADESQRFANYKTITFKSMMAIYGKWKFCLSGTPIRNYNTDIWSQFRYCGFSTVNNARNWGGITSFDTYNLKRFLYIKTYEDVGTVIPQKTDIYYDVNMSEKQLNLYMTYLQKIKDMLALASNTVNLIAILAVFTRLRQVCIAPYIIVRPKARGNKLNDETLQKSYDINTPDGDWIREKEGDSGFLSPKIVQIVDIIKHVPKGEKVIIFSMFTSCLQTIEEAVHSELPSINSEYLDGSITSDNRIIALDRFKYDPTVTVIYINYKVGGEGLNITAANHVICIEPWWTHAVHNQAIARAWRKNQTKEVKVHWVLIKNSIEEEILKMCENKTGMANKYIFGTDHEAKKVSLNRAGLSDLIENALNKLNK